MSAVHELGYTQPSDRILDEAQEVSRFVLAMTAYQQKYEVAYPACEDLLAVLKHLGYERAASESLTVVKAGLPIDRRRHEEDERQEKSERRASLEPSAQELLNLTEEEHEFLDALKDLRQKTGRQFASSEELLSIMWDLGYRPSGENGFPVQWLDNEERSLVQIAFTNKVEQRIAGSTDGEFLTCRSFLEIAAELGFHRQS